MGWDWTFGLSVLDCLYLEAELLECTGELVLLARIFCPGFVFGLHLHRNELLYFVSQVLNLLAG